jgi:hypothetical protein
MQRNEEQQQNDLSPEANRETRLKFSQERLSGVMEHLGNILTRPEIENTNSISFQPSRSLSNDELLFSTGVSVPRFSPRAYQSHTPQQQQSAMKTPGAGVPAPMGPGGTVAGKSAVKTFLLPEFSTDSIGEMFGHTNNGGYAGSQPPSTSKLDTITRTRSRLQSLLGKYVDSNDTNSTGKGGSSSSGGKGQLSSIAIGRDLLSRGNPDDISRLFASPISPYSRPSTLLQNPLLAMKDQQEYHHLHTTYGKCRLWNYSDFLSRLKTFSFPLTWFGKPDVLSPIACALFGWCNIDIDMIYCFCCRESYKHSSTLNSVEEMMRGVNSTILRDLHTVNCEWRKACDSASASVSTSASSAVVPPCRLYFANIPGYDSQEKLVEFTCDRFIALLSYCYPLVEEDGSNSNSRNKSGLDYEKVQIDRIEKNQKESRRNNDSGSDLFGSSSLSLMLPPVAPTPTAIHATAHSASSSLAVPSSSMLGSFSSFANSSHELSYSESPQLAAYQSENRDTDRDRGENGNETPEQLSKEEISENSPGTVAESDNAAVGGGSAIMNDDVLFSAFETLVQHHYPSSQVETEDLSAFHQQHQQQEQQQTESHDHRLTKEEEAPVQAFEVLPSASVSSLIRSPEDVAISALMSLDSTNNNNNNISNTDHIESTSEEIKAETGESCMHLLLDLSPFVRHELDDSEESEDLLSRCLFDTSASVSDGTVIEWGKDLSSVSSFPVVTLGEIHRQSSFLQQLRERNHLNLFHEKTFDWIASLLKKMKQPQLQLQRQRNDRGKWDMIQFCLLAALNGWNLINIADIPKVRKLFRWLLSFWFLSYFSYFFLSFLFLSYFFLSFLFLSYFFPRCWSSSCRFLLFLHLLLPLLLVVAV